MQNDAVYEYLDTTIKALVDKPESVKVVKTIDEMGVLMTVDVDGEDMGKLIGRLGATAKSIRTLLRVVGMKHNQRVNMKINEPVGRRTPAGAQASDVDAAIADLKSDM
jgi:predicted RNA-binding protein YlqC (UPF0109 family)